MPETFHGAYPKHRNSDRLKNPSHEAHTHSGPPAGFPVFYPAPSPPGPSLQDLLPYSAPNQHRKPHRTDRPYQKRHLSAECDTYNTFHTALPAMHNSRHPFHRASSQSRLFFGPRAPGCCHVKTAPAKPPLLSAPRASTLSQTVHPFSASASFHHIPCSSSPRHRGHPLHT